MARETGEMSVLGAEELPGFEAGQMSSVEKGQMSAAGAGQMSAVLQDRRIVLRQGRAPSQ